MNLTAKPTDTLARQLGRGDAPRVVADLCFWTLFEHRSTGNPDWILGSRTINRYLIIDNERKELVERILKLFDGRHQIPEIELILQEQQQKSVDVFSLYTKLFEHGLVIGAPPPAQDSFGFERLSIRLLHFKVNYREWKLLQFIKPVIPHLFGLFLAVCALGCAAFLEQPSLLHVTWFNHGSGASLTSGRAHWYAMLIIILSIAAHEFAHGVAAFYYGLRVSTVTGSLYLGFIPMVYLRIPGVYTLSPTRRLIVWGAGVFTNFTIAAAGVLFLSSRILPFPWPAAVHAASLANLTIGIANLFPFLPTDGYYIACTLLGVANVRSRAWRELARLFALREVRFSSMSVLYLSCSLCLIVYAVGKILSHTFGSGPRLSAIHVWGWIQLLLLLLGLGYGFVREIVAVRKRRTRPMNNLRSPE